jgi:gliding motility-associated-like protein
LGDGTITSQTNPVHRYTQPGTYVVRLTVAAPDACAQTVSKEVTLNVGGAGLATFEANPPVTQLLMLPNADIVFTNTSHNAVSYLWQFGDGVTSTAQNPAHSYQLAGNYQVLLTITTPDGCNYTSFPQQVTVLAPELSLPDVFTPNGDGFNDVWRIGYNGNEPVIVNVLDRFGRLVFSTNNPNTGWTGLLENGTEIPEGVYFYSVQIGGKSYTGNITLIR